MPNGLFNLKQQLRGIQQGAWTGQKTPAVNYLVVAGGGGGGNCGGGGGAGGLLQGNIPVAIGSAITVTVGNGGAGATSSSTFGTSGGNSVFGSISATGGGGGGSNATAQVNGVSGSSGGGAGSSGAVGTGGSGISGQGNSGGANNQAGTGYGAGGGGGAGTVGLNGGSTLGGNGGAGIASDISGTRTTYAGGGGGGVQASNTAGVGGAGGGANGTNSTTIPTAATANTGGGGGGSGYTSGFTTGGAGGSGIVILSYPDTYAAATSTTGSPTVSTSGSGSISFNGGSSLYLGYGAQTPFVFGTGDFTIEFWVYFNNFTGGPILIDWRAGGANGALPTIYVTAGGVLTYFTSSADRITSSALSTATWYHVVVCRTGTSTKMYVNGAQAGSTYSDSSNYTVNSNGPSIGNPSGTSLNGYMSNIRIVKGNCVYTGAFTVPTSPLTATQSAGTNISAITGTQTSLLLNSVSGAYLADSSTNSYAATVTGSTIAWNSSSPFSTGLGYKNRVYTWTSSGSITF